MDVTPDADSIVDQIDADCYRERWQYFRQCKSAIEGLDLKAYQFGMTILETDEGHLNNSVDDHWYQQCLCKSLLLDQSMVTGINIARKELWYVVMSIISLEMSLQVHCNFMEFRN